VSEHYDGGAANAAHVAGERITIARNRMNICQTVPHEELTPRDT
jgi:hypothetical protein